MKERVLFVDNDKNLLSECERRFRKDFSVDTANSGQSGLIIIKKNGPYAVIISGLRMPRMDGLEFLSQVKTIAPNSMRILFTGNADREVVIKVVRDIGVFRVLVKPCEWELLSKTINEGIERYRTIMNNYASAAASFVEIEAKTEDDPSHPVKSKPAPKKENIVQEIISKFSRGEFNLPTLPQVHAEFKKLMKKGANFEEIANFLKKDISISSKLISVSNSAFYRGVEQNNTLEQALGRLGLKEAAKYVEAICNRMLYSGIDKKYDKIMVKMWEHSFSCAHASQIVAEELKMKTQEDMFTLGLLHDVGRLIILKIVSDMDQKGAIGKEVDKLKILDSLDNNHGKFGKALLKGWKFSSIYGDICINHNNLEEIESASNDLLVVNFANLLVKSMGYTRAELPEIDMESQEITGRLKINLEVIEKIKEQVKEVVEGSKNLFT